ncbi:MAG: potassium transporter TrkG, partial [Planctomycetota bacterium]
GDIVSKSITITFFSGMCIILGSILLLITEENTLDLSKNRGQFLELLFEATSASGTVGLSMGITASLSVLGKLLITLLMFIGRLGPLTITAAIGKQEKLSYHYATEEILVG